MNSKHNETCTLKIKPFDKLRANGINHSVPKLKAIWLLFVLCPLLALADNDHDLARELKQAGDILPLEHILEKVQRLHPGHVLEVELEKQNQRYVYEIETVDKKGSVWEMQFDAKTGVLLNTEKEK